jgi:Sortase domain
MAGSVPAAGSVPMAGPSPYDGNVSNVAAVRPQSPPVAGLMPSGPGVAPARISAMSSAIPAPETARWNGVGDEATIVDWAKSGRSGTAPQNPATPANASDRETSAAAPGRVPEKRSTARRAILPLTAAAAAAFVAVTGYLAVTETRPQSEVGRWSTAGAIASGAPGAESWNPAASTNVNPFGQVGPVLTGLPTRLKIKQIGVDASLESLHIGKGGVLDPPKTFSKAGWYADGTVPGDDGPAIIAGHVDSKSGPAVFYKLRELQAGDRIQVVRGGKTVTFTVTSAAWYPKAKFPTAQVYGPTPDRQLRLITCGGVFNHTLRSYKDNLVVYAVAG